MKKLIFSFIVILLSGIVALIVTRSNNKSLETLNNASIEALAGVEGCLVIPDDKKGVCKQNVNGLEYNCVIASWWQTKDCTSD